MNPYIKLPNVPIVSSRQNLVLERCKDKKVLHLGCVDAGLLVERFEQGNLMHQKLSMVSSDLWGLDIDIAGIAFLQHKGFKKLMVGDVCHLNLVRSIEQEQFDVIIASEVVEHLQNPGLFFQSVQKAMVPGHTELIISVPNAFRISTLLWLLQGVEFIHPDHNYWFSYHTITNLIRKNGFCIQEVYVYAFQKGNILPNRIQKLFKDNHSKIKPTITVQELPSKHSMFQRGLMYFRSIPKRILISSLYKTTSFWGDGLIVIAKINPR